MDEGGRRAFEVEAKRGKKMAGARLLSVCRALLAKTRLAGLAGLALAGLAGLGEIIEPDCDWRMPGSKGGRGSFVVSEPAVPQRAKPRAGQLEEGGNENVSSS